MINIKSIKPMHTKIVVTAERYDDNTSVNGIIVKTKGSLKEYQKVVAVGPMIRDIKVGDTVMINPSRYIKKKYDDNSLREEFVENPVVSINIPTIEMNNVPYFLIDGNVDVDYIIEDYEEVDPPQLSPIIQPKPVTTESKSIIL